MADVNAKIGVQIDTSAALAELKALQRQLANFHSSVAKGSAASAAAQKNLQYNLLNSINSTGKFYAQMGLVRTSTESFTHALEKNKLSMREYFRYAGGASKTFGRLFKQEFDTIGKVAEERVKRMSTQYIKMGRDASGAMKAMSITPTTLNMKDYGTQVALAAQRQALFNQLLKQGSTNLLNFGKNTQWAGRQLMVGFTIPLAYFGTAASKTFMDLEKQAIKFRRVYGDIFTTTEETDKALADIQKLAQEFTKYGVAVVDTMEMAAQAAAMGKTGAELTAQVAEATRLAVLGGVEQAKALETTISVTNAFGISADDLRKKIDFLNAVENQTVVSIEDLTEAIPKAGPVVKQLGGSVEDLAFFLTAMKEGGINASEGANALKSGLASLINPSDKAAEFLAKLGINIKGIVEANKGDLKATVIGFAQALDTLDPLNRARAVEQLFGKFQFARLSTLFQNITKEGTQASRVLDLAGASIEELAILSERELKKVEDAVGVNFREAVEKLKVTLAPIGKIFLQTVTPLIETLGKVFEKFDGLSEGTKKFIVVAGTLIGGIGPILLMTFGLVANAIANIIKLFVTMRGGFLKAGTTSKVLADQTQYLSSEQLEAATVATSLNQAHNRLTQSFNTETIAIQMLRQAYIDATAAAARFAATNPGMMGPGFRGFGPKKLASGTTGVIGGTPGKDSVPSLLMPGEAVIPTKIAQDDRFKPLVESLVTGKIAQYGSGTVFAHAVDKKILSGTRVPENIRSLGFNSANAFTSVGFDLTPETNSKLIKGNVLVQDYINELNKPGSTKTMTARLIDLGIGPKDAVKVTSQIKSNLANSLINIPAGSMIGDKDIYSRMGNLRTGVLGGIVRKSRGGIFGQAVQSLYSPTAYSPRGLSQIQMNSNAAIGDVISAVKKTNTSQSALIPLKRVQELDPNYRIPVKIDPTGKIIAFERPEISKTTGRISNTRVIGALQGNKFRTARLSRGGGRRITPSRGAMDMATQLLVGKGELVQTKDGRVQMVNSTTGNPKLTGSNVVGGGISDRRSLPLTTVKRVIPRFRGLALGADTGFPPVATGKPFTQTASGLLVPQTALVDALNKNTQIQEDGNKTQTQSGKTQKELLKDQRAARADRIGRVSGPLGMVAGTAAMAGYMSGNTGIGNVAMGISALSTVAPMLANPIGLFVLSLTAATAMIWKMNKEVDKARQEGKDFATAMSMSSTRVKDLSMLSGKVSASEIQSKKRQNALNPLGEAQRKFGQNVLGGETGQQILSDVENMIKQNFSSEKIGKILGTNLSQAVLQGAITADQAASISSALGEELKNYEISANITGTINRLVGPNGERLDVEPLQIALEIKKDTMRNVNEQFKLAQTERKPLVTASGGATMAAGTAVAASLLAGAPATGGATLIPAAAVFLTTYGKTLWDQNKAKAANAKLDAAAVQLGIEAIGQNQQLVDSINEYYDKKIKIAKTEKEINDLQDERKTKLDDLNKANSQTLQDIIKLSGQVSSDAFNKGITTAVTDKYKGASGGQKIMSEVALDQLGKLKDENIKRTLQIGFATENGLDPSSIIGILNLISKSDTASKTIELFIKENGFAELNVLEQLFGKFGDDLAPKQKEYFINYINKNGPELKDDVKALSALANFKSQYDVSLDVNTNGLADMQLASIALRQVETLPDKLTKSMVADLAIKDPAAWSKFYADWDTLSQGKPEISKYLKVNYDIGTVDPNLQKAADTANMTVPEFLARGFDNSLFTTPQTKTPQEPGPRDTTFDDILINLKRTRDATIDATGGAKELMRVLGGNKDITIFKGLDQQLASLGANSDFMNFVGGLDKAIQNKIINISKKGVVSLTELGEAAKKAYNEKQLGLFQAEQINAIKGAQAQRGAFLKLTDAGATSAEALELVADTELAIAINSKTSTEEVDRFVNSLRTAKKVAEETARANDPIGAFRDDMEKANKLFDLRERQARAKYQPEIDRVNKLIDNTQERIDKLQTDAEMQFDRPIQALQDETRALNHDLTLISQASDKINEKYDKQREALESIYSINERIAQQQKSRITLADALTQGDISAAAQAAQDIRNQSQEYAQQDSLAALERARQSELGALTSASGLTKLQIEERLSKIAEQTYALETKRQEVDKQILKLQDEIYSLKQNQLKVAEDALKAELDAIEAQRAKWEEASLAIDSAEANAAGYNDLLLKSEETLKRMAELWKSMGAGITATAAKGAITGPLGGGTGATSAAAAFGYTDAAAYRSYRAGERMYGGLIRRYDVGGIVAGSGMTDKVPSLLTPGEYVVNKAATQRFGPLLEQINESKYPGSLSLGGTPAVVGLNNNMINNNSTSVYNYSLQVDVNGSSANPDDIARTVIAQIRNMDAQRLRGNKY